MVKNLKSRIKVPFWEQDEDFSSSNFSSERERTKVSLRVVTLKILAIPTIKNNLLKSTHWEEYKPCIH